MILPEDLQRQFEELLTQPVVLEGRVTHQLMAGQSGRVALIKPVGQVSAVQARAWGEIRPGQACMVCQDPIGSWHVLPTEGTQLRRARLVSYRHSLPSRSVQRFPFKALLYKYNQEENRVEAYIGGDRPPALIFHARTLGAGAIFNQGEGSDDWLAVFTFSDTIDFTNGKIRVISPTVNYTIDNPGGPYFGGGYFGGGPKETNVLLDNFTPRTPSVIESNNTQGFFTTQLRNVFVGAGLPRSDGNVFTIPCEVNSFTESNSGPNSERSIETINEQITIHQDGTFSKREGTSSLYEYQEQSFRRTVVSNNCPRPGDNTPNITGEYLELISPFHGPSGTTITTRSETISDQNSIIFVAPGVENAFEQYSRQVVENGSIVINENRSNTTGETIATLIVVGHDGSYIFGAGTQEEYFVRGSNGDRPFDLFHHPLYLETIDPEFNPYSLDFNLLSLDARVTENEVWFSAKPLPEDIRPGDITVFGRHYDLLSPSNGQDYSGPFMGFNPDVFTIVSLNYFPPS